MLAPVTATVLPVSADSRTGREAQSIAFFRPPGMEPLYSGVAKRIASAAAPGLAQACDRLGGAVLLEILVVERQVGEAGRIEELDLDALRRGLDGRAEERRVVRAGAQAAGDRQDSHHDYASAFTNASSAMSFTSFAT